MSKKCVIDIEDQEKKEKSNVKWLIEFKWSTIKQVDKIEECQNEMTRELAVSGRKEGRKRNLIKWKEKLLPYNRGREERKQS